MNAIIPTVVSDIRRRRVQSVVIAVVLFLASGATTLALSLLDEANGPYDRAFAAVRGAHITVTYDSSHASLARIRRTAGAAPVTEAAGPFPEVQSIYSTALGGATGLAVIGRGGPGGPLDQLTMESGRWAQRAGEVVVERRLADRLELSVGSRLTPAGGGRRPDLTVVGIAASISPLVDAWVLPSQISALTAPGYPLQEQMLYRVRHAGTDAALQSSIQKITAGLPPTAVRSVDTYLQIEQNASRTTNVMIPFLLAFGIFALVASILIIGNVVSGVVISGYRDIGVMKAVGFTPLQVVLVLLGDVLGVGVLACLAGIAAGTVLSQPFLASTAHALDLPAAFTAPLPIDLGVFVLVIVASVLATVLPARRAARLDSISAITRGSSPVSDGPPRFVESASRLPVPVAVSLGIEDLLARPVRSLTTAVAVLAGVATAVFGISLHLSLGQVAEHLIRDRYAQIEVFTPGGGQKGQVPSKPGAPLALPTPPSDRQVMRMLGSDPQTRHIVAEGQSEVTFPQLGEPVVYYAYRGPSAWTGYALIAGRWFRRPGEVVAPSRVLEEGHLHIGQRFVAFHGSRAMQLTLVGEILDQDNNDLLLRGTWSTLAAVEPHLSIEQYEVQLVPGASPEEYGHRHSRPALYVRPTEQASENTTFILFNSVIAGLALVVILIAAAGVFNTVVLATRERARDTAILKAVGMAPRGVIAMVLVSVGILGIVAGSAGIPVGLLLHARVLTLMGRVASDTRIPPAFYDLIPHSRLPLLVLVGVIIAVVGAWIPAGWAARAGVTEVLQSE
jgi:putative ABC transport system permease protein